MLGSVIVLNFDTELKWSKEHKVKAFLFANGAGGCLFGLLFVIPIWTNIYLLTRRDMRDPRYLDEMFEDLNAEPPYKDEPITEQSKRGWYINSRPRYLRAANRLKEVKQYWESKPMERASREALGQEKGVHSPWESYASQLRQSLDDRKGAVFLSASWIDPTKYDALTYSFVRTLCQDILRLEDDISEFWNEGWEELTKEEPKHQDKEKNWRSSEVVLSRWFQRPSLSWNS